MILADRGELFVAGGLLLAETKLGGGTEVFRGEVFGEELRPRGSGDHGGVVGRECKRREGDGQAAAVGFSLEAAAEFAVGGDSAGDDDAAGAKGFSGGERLALQVADDGVLEGGDEVQGLLVAEFDDGFGSGREAWISSQGGAAGLYAVTEMMGFDETKDRGLDPAEGEVEVWAFGT